MYLNFNELTEKLFDGYKGKVIIFDARSTELHAAWAEMLYSIPNFFDVKCSGTGDLVSSSGNIKNIFAFLTSRDRAENEKQKEKNLIDILNNGRNDANFAFKGSSNKNSTEETICLQKKASESENEEFSFVLSVYPGHSCLKGPAFSGYSTFAYEISNDTGRLHVSSLYFSNPAGELSFECAQENIERPWMNYFLEKPILSYGIDKAVMDILSKIRADIGNEDCANWLKSMIETNTERRIVSVEQTAVDDTSDEGVTSVVRRVTDKIRKNPLSVSAPNMIAGEIINEIINSLQIAKADTVTLLLMRVLQPLMLSYFIGLNQVKCGDARLFEALNKVLTLKANVNEIPLTDKTCSKLLLSGYLYDLVNSKLNLFVKFNPKSQN